ncbi:glycoside hydrolase family 32 protein [Halosimplex amylolyticum]|uniref:glycoside hydrolase family 32 protein n=1 Tax=Halosimplex amylolyticum TaxID=3396616 RepID=UPI003F56A790
MDRRSEAPSTVRESGELTEFERNRQTFTDDPYRPDYHFVPPGGLLHDPNGALYWNGRYHLFYQFWPPDVSADRTWSEAMHWGHAVSDDLVHWQDLPIALSPDGGPEDGCFSGQALVEGDRAVLMYFGTEAGNCIATATGPFLTEIEKSDANPVIPLDESAPYEVFDPCIWRADGNYCSLSGWKVDRRTTEFLFESSDLTEWEYRGPIVQDGFYTDPDEDGAVPNFFALDGKHVLLFFSHTRGPQYYVGDYDSDAGVFEIETHGRLNYGPITHSNLHAPSVLREGDRRVAFFNVVEGIDDWGEQPGEGWAGVISLPRDLSVVDGELRLAPVDELETLRTDHWRVESVSLPANNEWVAPRDGGRSFELRAEIDVGDARVVDLSVLRSPDGGDATTVSYWAATDSLGIDIGQTDGRSDALGRPPETGSVTLDDEEHLDLRVFVDKSIVEVFANGRETLTTRVYPDPENTGIALSAHRGTARLESLDIWDMENIWVH